MDVPKEEYFLLFFFCFFFFVLFPTVTIEQENTMINKFLYFFLVFPEPYLYTSIFYGVHGSMNICLYMSNGSLFLPPTLNSTIGKLIL